MEGLVAHVGRLGDAAGPEGVAGVGLGTVVALPLADEGVGVVVSSSESGDMATRLGVDGAFSGIAPS